MKTLIFSIYISSHGVYQWEVKMFLNSWLTWSLGQVARKRCVAGVKIEDRGILGAMRSCLSHSCSQLAQGLSWTIWTLTLGLFTVYYLGITNTPNITPTWAASPFFSMPFYLAFTDSAHPTPEGKPHVFTLEPVILLKENRAINNNASQAVEQRAGLIYLAYKKIK